MKDEKEYVEFGVCLYCGKDLEKEIGISKSEAKRRRFCSRSHSAKYNNSKSPKRKIDRSKTLCGQCGGKKSYGSAFCHSCKRKNTLDKVWSTPMQNYLLKNGASRAKYESIRSWARTYMEDFDDRKKECEICGYNKVVDVAHVEPLSSFDETCLMSEVNAPNNLLYLCPNHHEEFDRGIMDEEDLKKISKVEAI